MAGTGGAARFAFVALAAIGVACTPAPSAPADAGPLPSASSTPVPSAPLPLSPRTPLDAGTRAHLVLPCRVMALAGSPTIAFDGGASALAQSSVAAGWVTLTASDSMTVTLPRTARELTFLGPGLAHPCVGTDEAWLLRGRFQGARGSGESPGADQWVVTPFAVLRYGSAILEVAVDEGAVHASLKGGSATILPEGASSWELLDTKGPRVVPGAPLGPAGATASAARCAKATGAATALEDALLRPGATTAPTFSDLAMRANDAHVLARAACAVAKLRADEAAGSGASPRTR
jgi:hypothetical protein